MEIEIIEPSVWSTVTGILCALGVFTLLAGFVSFAVAWKPKVSLGIVVAGFLVAFGAGMGNSALSEDRTEQMESSFSQQLTDEYHASSSRSLEEIRKDFYEYNEASTVFTRDGEQTAVFVKKIGDDDKNLTMVFTVLDEQTYYPKAK